MISVAPARSAVPRGVFETTAPSQNGPSLPDTRVQG